MKVTIEGSPKEIADLVKGLQDRLVDSKEFATVIAQTTNDGIAQAIEETKKRYAQQGQLELQPQNL